MRYHFGISHSDNHLSPTIFHNASIISYLCGWLIHSFIQRFQFLACGSSIAMEQLRGMQCFYLFLLLLRVFFFPFGTWMLFHLQWLHCFFTRYMGTKNLKSRSLNLPSTRTRSESPRNA